ncbi:SAM-dependent methyltransferase [Handroanthus impetiginosus]|uniref:Methyltransferase n=1 Tax=Handroanthus impetiginosus TaxID=429701 RepID=A0A2G9GTM8_9LAMI|nr:SAM-dependent methyltransferase [Handroanthus impetiginosus]
MEKKEVLTAVDKYERYHIWYGGKEEERKSNYADMVNKFYDLVTIFYEWKGETLQNSLKRHEHFIALELGLKPGQKVLDIGCGIGGPLREISRFSYTSITGLNNSEYQISRAKADFMNMPFPDNSFDAAYAIEATCHAPDVVACYKEICRVLKPGQCFAAYEWCMTDAFDPNNKEHQRIKVVPIFVEVVWSVTLVPFFQFDIKFLICRKKIELGNGLPNIRLTRECLDALKKTGFEVVWERDLALDSPIPWYLPIDTSHFSLRNFHLTGIGRFFNRNMLVVLEKIGIAPKGSQRVHVFLDKGAEGLVAGGKKGIFTPSYFFLARKLLSTTK